MTVTAEAAHDWCVKPVAEECLSGEYDEHRERRPIIGA